MQAFVCIIPSQECAKKLSHRALKGKSDVLLLLWLHACNSRGQGLHIFWLSVRPFLMNVISQGRLEGSSSNLAQTVHLDSKMN